MRHLKPGDSILELGNQTIYFGSSYGHPAKPMFEGLGYAHVSVDINGQDGAIECDLSKKLDLKSLNKMNHYDVVTDFGTSEHVKDFYNCWLNKWNACKENGLIVSENPKTGNWKGHGHHYLTKEFYKGFDTLEMGEHCAMGNCIDGLNIYSVVRKTGKFMTRKEFNKLEYYGE